MPGVDVLLVSLGSSTSGWKRTDAALAGALERAGASVARAVAAPTREVRTLMLTDLVQARAARAAAVRGIAEHDPRAVIYSTTTAALLWPRPGAIHFDALAAANRPGRHGLWQRALERRRLAQATALVPLDAGALREAGLERPDAIVVPVPVEPSGPGDGARDLAAITYAANPDKKGLDRVLAAWARVRRADETLVVAGTAPGAAGARRRVGRPPPLRRVPRAAAPRARLRHRAAARGLRPRPARGAGRRLRARDHRGARRLPGGPARARPGPAARRRRPGPRAARRPRRAEPGLRRARDGGAGPVRARGGRRDRARPALLPRLLGG